MCTDAAAIFVPRCGILVSCSKQQLGSKHQYIRKRLWHYYVDRRFRPPITKPLKPLILQLGMHFRLRYYGFQLSQEHIALRQNIFKDPFAWVGNRDHDVRLKPSNDILKAVFEYELPHDVIKPCMRENFLPKIRSGNIES